MQAQLRERQKALLCDYFDDLTPDQCIYMLVTAQRCAEKNRAKRPNLHLVVSVAPPVPPFPLPIPEAFPDPLAASS